MLQVECKESSEQTAIDFSKQTSFVFGGNPANPKKCKLHFLMEQKLISRNKVSSSVC